MIDELREATDKLNKLSPNVKAIIGDEVTQLMINEEATVALNLVWSSCRYDV